MVLLYLDLTLSKKDKTFSDYKPSIGEHGCILCFLVLSRTSKRDVHWLKVTLNLASYH